MTFVLRSSGHRRTGLGIFRADRGFSFDTEGRTGDQGGNQGSGYKSKGAAELTSFSSWTWACFALRQCALLCCFASSTSISA